MIKFLIASFILLSSGIVYGNGGTAATKVLHIDSENKDESGEFLKKELMCLAKNIYFEAGNQSYIGKVAVALVTKNRVGDKRWPNTYCGVVEQGPTWSTKNGEKFPVKYKCQFSWYCDGKTDVPFLGEKWKESTQIAEIIYFTNLIDNILDRATHYHADYVSPAWSKHLEKVTQIDRHIFYR